MSLPAWACTDMVLRLYEWHSRPTRLHKLAMIAIATFLLAVSHRFLPLGAWRSEFESPLSEQYVRWGPFQAIEFPGFLNSGVPGKRSCDTLKYNGTVGVQKSHHIYDNLTAIALSLDSHPVVEYSESTLKDPNLKLDDIVGRAWARMSGSSIWLPDQRVFLVVTRIVHLGAKEILSAPRSSFLRGQVFDENWEQLENHTIAWEGGETLVFPLVFKIPTEYEGGEGEFYGPEDPRIILEDGVKGAEPIIIFNMAHSRSGWKRAMYIFRPFSNFSTILTIRDKERQDREKNWAPFFLSPGESGLDSSGYHPPSEYLHFVYGFKPLRVLKCHLRCGDCDMVFEQNVPESFVTQHNEDGASLNGGTNFVPISIPAAYRIHPEVQAYAAFPRTNVDKNCGNGHFYRPEFVVMVNIKSHFHLAFASKALDFGSAILETTPSDDPCEKGRILIPNSISRWDTRQDVMTMTWSVDDRSVQVARLHGVLAFVRSLPQFHGLLRADGPLKTAEHDLMDIVSSWMGDEVRACSVESGVNYTVAAKEMHELVDPSPVEPVQMDHSVLKLSLKVEEEAALARDPVG